MLIIIPDYFKGFLNIPDYFKALWIRPDYFKGLSDIDNNKMFDLLNKINNTHTLVHFHGNNGCRLQKIDGIDLPHLFELTYIRNDYVSEKIRNTDPLPTLLDMKNILNKPDYELKGFPYC